MHKFSVTIPLYNKENYILRAINSILEQEYEDFEIIIVDDGSTDDGIQKVLALNNNKVRIIRQKNAGVSAARNRGVEESNSKYCAFLDADDEWRPNFLNIIDSLITEYPFAKVFCCAYELRNEKQLIQPDFWPYQEETKTGIVDNYFLSRVKGPNLMHPSCVCIDKQVFQELGGFPIGEKMGEDQDLWIRIALKHDIAFSKDIAMVYNVGLPNSACKINLPDENIVHLKNLKSNLENNNIPLKFRRDAKIFYEKELMGLSILQILNNKTEKARSIIWNSNFEIFFFKKASLFFLSLLPHFLIKLILKKYNL